MELENLDRKGIIQIMKFKDYMIKEAFDEIGKELEKIMKMSQKSNDIGKMKNTITYAMKFLGKYGSLNHTTVKLKGVKRSIEMFVKDYKSIVSKIGIDMTLNMIGIIQKIELDMAQIDGYTEENPKDREQLRKIETDVRDSDDLLKRYTKGNKYDINRLLTFFESMEEDLKMIEQVKKRVDKRKR